jgi:hypothetical protein
MPIIHDVIGKIQELFSRKDKRSIFRARQLMFLTNPLSNIVERYLYDNEGQLQKLHNFPMMRNIYDEIPQKLLLKCSRKTLKSTLLSNVITLNMIRYNHYHMLYLGPNEKFTKYFSSNYLSARFASPSIQKIVTGLRKDDVFEKILGDTESSVLLAYASEDATRTRGPATDHNIHDEVQDMHFDILPIVAETMTLSGFKREIFAGTPLTKDNTINNLWKRSNQLEWMTKCGCGHWNSLTEENDALKMIREEGYSCSKCSKLINTREGLWVETNPNVKNEITGFHLAQPILPHFNQDPKEWKNIYTKVTSGRYSIGQVHNEVFGIAYDVGSKPITEEQLKAVCVLGNMDTVLERRKQDYVVFTLGADWGVNMSSSRTAAAMCALRSDGIIEVFFAKIYKDFDYDAQIKDLALRSNAVNAFNAADGGPDPNRAIQLARYTDFNRTQIVRYEHGKFIQHQDIPKNAIDPSQYRWCLHRSDTITFTLNLIKNKQILFPQWDHVSECMQDILNMYIEVKEGALRQELFYRHGDDAPDDFLHALNFAAVQAHVWAGNMALRGTSSSHSDPAEFAS